MLVNRGENGFFSGMSCAEGVCVSANGAKSAFSCVSFADSRGVFLPNGAFRLPPVE